jgi:hypothetical protein
VGVVEVLGPPDVANAIPHGGGANIRQSDEPG